MRTLTKTDERTLGFLATACYLISVGMCAVSAYAVVQLSAAATSDAVQRLYQPLGIF